MFFGIKPEILRFLKRKEVLVGMEEQNIKTDWQNIVSKVNKKARDKSFPTHMTKDRELVVKVVNNMWMQELSFFKEDIKKEINKKSTIVKSIRFVG